MFNNSLRIAAIGMVMLTGCEAETPDFEYVYLPGTGIEAGFKSFQIGFKILLFFKPVAESAQRDIGKSMELVENNTPFFHQHLAKSLCRLVLWRR